MRASKDRALSVPSRRKGTTEPRAFARDLDRSVARKRFGQHFLTDPSIIDQLVSAIGPERPGPLVEIGPGRGALTEPLLAARGALTVIEIDRDLAARWRSRPGLTVIEADVLRVDFAALAQTAAEAAGAGGAASLRVVGNLPYNISTPILFHLMEAAPSIVEQCFMLQREVVERMVAEPCTKAYGRLSVMLQWRYDMRWLLDVPPQAFDPPPRVESAVVSMRPLTQPLVDRSATLSELVTVAFSQRRKLLRHTLGRWLDEAGHDTPFDLQRRAEEVPVAEYAALAREVDARQ